MWNSARLHGKVWLFLSFFSALRTENKLLLIWVLRRNCNPQKDVKIIKKNWMFLTKISILKSLELPSFILQCTHDQWQHMPACHHILPEAGIKWIFQDFQREDCALRGIVHVTSSLRGYSGSFGWKSHGLDRVLCLVLQIAWRYVQTPSRNGSSTSWRWTHLLFCCLRCALTLLYALCALNINQSLKIITLQVVASSHWPLGVMCLCTSP